MEITHINQNNMVSVRRRFYTFDIVDCGSNILDIGHLITTMTSGLFDRNSHHVDGHIFTQEL